LVRIEDLDEDKQDTECDNYEIFYQTLICEADKASNEVSQELAHAVQ